LIFNNTTDLSSHILLIWFTRYLFT